MQILISDSWLREFLETNASPKDIQKCLSLCGPSIERLHEKNGDYVYDIEVTTNRVDCMSVAGIAREAYAILPRFGYTAKLLKNPWDVETRLSTTDKVSYLNAKVDPALCSRFSAVLIRNVKIQPSPEWMQKKLELVGVRAINNVVDISNYLMYELGQPVHMFDYDKISKTKMILRESKPHEMVTTLDGSTHKLPGGDIVIEDGSGNLIDLCGIMGGQLSEIDEHTQNVLLFVQTYEPTHIRKTSMSTALRTDAAVLFEKSLPQESVLPTLYQGIQLLENLTGGISEKQILDIFEPSNQSHLISLTQPLSKFTSQRLGVTLSEADIKSLILPLGFTLKGDLHVTIPWYRKFDIQISEDVVEEVARIYGYHNLPSQLMSGEIPLSRPYDNQLKWEYEIKSALKYWGYTETYTYSLVPNGEGLKLKNPLTTEWVYLRTSLIPSHQQVIKENLGRIPEINLFEIANVYVVKEKDLPEEASRLVISSSSKDTFKLKGIVEALSEMVHVKLSYELVVDENCVAVEINLTGIFENATHTTRFTPISKFTPIIEDINLILNQPYPELVSILKKLSPYIVNTELIDVYQQKITVRLTYHSPEKQLSSDDIEPVRKAIEALQ